MIKDRLYKDWSAEFHSNNSKNPIVIQMELTYKCPLHCLHCYTDCYNNARYTKKELTARKIKNIIDKLYNAGCTWLTFTGGDPLIRKDFAEIYNYAKDKGFIVSFLTSLAALKSNVLDLIIKKPPFSIEMTLNGATEKTYENISQIKGSFSKVMANIDKILNAGLPLKIKTLISKNNIHEIEKIKAFVESKGLNFEPSNSIFARLNGDTMPCSYRLPVDKTTKENMKNCESCMPKPDKLFRCAAGNWQWYVNPYGRLNICSCVREPSYDLLSGKLSDGVKVLSKYVKEEVFSSDSKCKTCDVWPVCQTCPGKAKLEMGDKEAPVPHFCALAKEENV